MGLLTLSENTALKEADKSVLVSKDILLHAKHSNKIIAKPSKQNSMVSRDMVVKAHTILIC